MSSPKSGIGRGILFIEEWEGLREIQFVEAGDSLCTAVYL